MTAPAAMVQLRRAALDLWQSLSSAQRRALREHLPPGDPSHIDPPRARIRVKTHPRTAEALRKLKLVRALDSGERRRDLTLAAKLAIKAALDVEAAQRRSRAARRAKR